MRRVLFLLSDTGNGHRAAAEAISTALILKHGEAVHCDFVDVFKTYMPFPFRQFPTFYPKMVKRSGRLYGMSFRMSNTPYRAKMLSRLMYLLSQFHLKKITQDYQPDVIVSTHSIITQPSISAFQQLPHVPPFVTVVVDLISTHTFWYDQRASVTLLPTEVAYNNAVQSGLHLDKIIMTGPLVNPKFLENITDKVSARQVLGWEQDVPTILLTGGGDGIGKLYTIARAINDNRLNCQLIIVAGRNKRLQQELQNSTWNQPTHIYGFVDNMHLMMSGADILVTKAGSLTISEACVVGLPMILYEAIPGQEDGNLDYIVNHKAGRYAPSIKTIVRRIKELAVDNPTLLDEFSSNARALSTPHAVWNIADKIWDHALTTELRLV